MEKYADRESVPEKYKWDLTTFFKNLDEFEESFKNTEVKIANLGKYVGCTKDVNKLKEFLDLYIDTLADWEDLYVYSALINDQEVGISENVERKNRCDILLDEFNANVNFFDPELLSLSKDEFETIINDSTIFLYKAYLENLYRIKEHVLSEDEERIMNEFITIISSYQDMASILLYSEHDYGKVVMDDGTEEVLSPTNYSSIMKKCSREKRKQIREDYFNIIDKYSKSNAFYLNEYVKMNTKLSKLRKYNTSWEQYLDSIKMNNKVFDSLISACEKRTDVFRKYYNIRKKGLKLDKLYFYDLPLDIANNDKEYSIEEGLEIIKNALIPMGEDYNKLYNRIIDNRYIDFCQYKGKYIGGYSFSTLKQDSRILLSYNGDMDSISTIIHEAGHNVHQQLISKNNNPIYCNVDTIVSEIASLTNECLLSNYLMKNGQTKDEKLSGIENLLIVSFSNLFGAVREGKMELDMYKHVEDGMMLTKEYMDNLTIDSLKQYYGDSICYDDEAKNGWVNRMHYFTSFYLFSYAISMCIALNSCERILNGDKEFLNKYIDFLKLGADRYQYDAIKELGFDLEDEKLYLDSIDYLEKLIDEFDAILSS